MRWPWQGNEPCEWPKRNQGRDKQLSAVAEFDSVGLRYGTGAEVLRDLDFSLGQGGFYFLTGPSGAGKTSLLRLLYLSLNPTRGLITLFGHDVATLSPDALATLRRRPILYKFGTVNSINSVPGFELFKIRKRRFSFSRMRSGMPTLPTSCRKAPL